ncbi:MAG: polysulfide reductase NrfD [Bacteroidales bacterium]|jgi:molybdopterin-containing oxidoreductase family membrane subunit|nr:polysulfide reductase NrfD [Bacteroidales bacterium]
MENEPNKLLKEFAPQLEQTSIQGYAWIIFLLAVIGLGLFAFITQVTHGHEVTGMRDNVVWGVYIVNFIFFMGISYAGALISGTLHLFKTAWRKPIIRMAEFITIISLLIGPCFILLCIGRLDRLYYLVIFGRIQSPITWDVIAISTDIFGCLIFLYLALLRDLATLRDYEILQLPKWRKKLYKIMALGYTGTEEQQKRLNRATNIMAAMVISIAIIVYSVLAWIFSVTLQPGWHSTIFGPYFVIAAVFSGSAVLIVCMWVFRKIYHLEEYITKKHFVSVGLIMLVLAAFFGYFTFSDYLTKWYGSEKNDELLIQLLFKEFYWPFIISNYVGVLLPLLVVGIAKFRTITNITLTAVVVIVALWLNRYLIVVPTLESPYLPIQDSRPEWLNYTATWVEWSLTAAGVAVFCLLFTLASKFITVVPVAGLTGETKPEEALV